MPYNPSQKLVFRIEIFINGAFVDVTQRTRAVGDVRIKMAKSPGAGQAETARLQCTIGNTDGYLTEGDPRSPWYPQIGRGTRIRFSVLDILVSPAVLFDGKIVRLVAGYSAGVDSTVTVTAVGRWGYLAINDDPVEPAMHRAILADSPTYYWRLEDPVGSVSAASAMPNGGTPMSISGTTNWRQLGSAPGGAGPGMAPELNQGIFEAEVPLAPPWTVEVVERRPADGNTDGSQTFQFSYNGFGSPIGLTSAADPLVSPRQWHHKLFKGQQIGPDWEIRYWKNGIDHGVIRSDTGSTLGNLTAIVAGGAIFFGGSPPFTDFSLGYIALYGHSNVDPQVHSDALQAFDGEMAHARISRMLTAEGIGVQITGTRSVRMGPQGTDALPNQIQACEDAGQGLLADGGTAGAITYLCNDNMTDRAVALAVTQGSLSDELPTTWDYQHTRNYVTSTRANGGGSFTAQDQSHVARVGAKLKLPATVNVQSDSQLPMDAGARLLAGTTPEPRYPGIPINMRSPDGAKLADAVLALAPGARMTVAEAALPATHPPGGIDGLVIGWEHRLDAFEWIFTPNVIPYAPFIVGVSDTDWSASKGLKLMIARSTTDTSWTVHTIEGPKVTTVGAQLPHQLVTDLGERLNLTAVSNVTPSYVAAGTAAHADNASVSPGLPAGLAAGDLLLVFAAIRNTAASVNIPSGFEVMANLGNVKLLGKFAASGETAPTVTFTGGSAGDTTSAQCAAWRGVGLSVHAVSPPQTNTSAQDIAYPGLPVIRDNCLVIVLGQKADDWTSVATLSGMTEIGEPSTITGNDQGLVWDYVLQTTATNIASGSFTVTGGAAAVSKATVIAIASDVQTFTVTRSVNNISKAHAVGTSIEVYRPLIAALD